MYRHRIYNARRTVLLAVTTAALSALPRDAWSASTINADGAVGLTSYSTLPFQGAILQQSWGAGAGLDPAQLFWQSGTHFTNPATMGNARGAAAGWSSIGIVPIAQAQRWEDTFEVAQPTALFPGEPGFADGSNFAGDRASGIAAGPEFQAWANWIRARPTLLATANDGGSVPSYFRPWNGSWGYVSPLMPLAPADCPNGMTSCTYGDWMAARWGQVAALSGAYGFGLSDFTTAQPGISTQMSYNPPLLAGFEAAEHVTVPAGNTAAQSAWIIANAMPAWNDYLSNGFARFFAAIATNVQTATGHQSLLVQQCSLWPALLRFYGVDQRLIRNSMPPANYLCAWDDQSMQVGRGGQDPVWGVGAYAVAAAREPDLRNGATIEANDSAYWNAISAFNPTLDAADQQEKGLKLLKRAWLEAAWAHVATRQGQVRRALSFVSRDYWDAGTLDPTLQTLISAIIPAAPFGYALYTSTSAERAVEQAVATGNPYEQAYDNPNEILALKNSGVPVNYYVSDAALPQLSGAARPAGWIIPEHPELIPANEMRALQAIAPVFTNAATATSNNAAPIQFAGGLTGTAFWDQNGRLIVTVTNPSSNNKTGTVTVHGVPNGYYTVTDLFAKTSFGVTISGEATSFPISVTRWDTNAFALLASD